MKEFLVIMLLVAFFSPANATQKTTPGGVDHRLRTIAYSPDVVVLPLFLGYASHVRFAKNETILKAVIGESSKYKVETSGNNLWVKISGAEAVGTTTNLLVLTSAGRDYNFFIESRKSTSHGRGRGVVFSVQFTYPLIAAEEERQRIAEEEAASAQAAKLADMKSRLERHTGTFSAHGSEALRPAGVWYKGSETHIRFRPGQLLPAVYNFTGNGEEFVRVRVEDMTLITSIPMMRFTLRRGDALMFIESIGEAARVKLNSTANDDVKRVLK